MWSKEEKNNKRNSEILVNDKQMAKVTSYERQRPAARHPPRHLNCRSLLEVRRINLTRDVEMLRRRHTCRFIVAGYRRTRYTDKKIKIEFNKIKWRNSEREPDRNLM